MKAIVAKTFIAVVQLWKNKSIGLALLCNLMCMNAWKVQNMYRKIMMFFLGCVEDDGAVAAGEFVFLKTKAAMVVTSGMMKH